MACHRLRVTGRNDRALKGTIAAVDWFVAGFFYFCIAEACVIRRWVGKCGFCGKLAMSNKIQFFSFWALFDNGMFCDYDRDLELKFYDASIKLCVWYGKVCLLLLLGHSKCQRNESQRCTFSETILLLKFRDFFRYWFWTENWIVSPWRAETAQFCVLRKAKYMKKPIRKIDQILAEKIDRKDREMWAQTRKSIDRFVIFVLWTFFWQRIDSFNRCKQEPKHSPGV